MEINILAVASYNDTVADLPILQEIVRECRQELDKIVYSVALGSLCEHSARYAIYYLQNEKACLEGRIQQIKREA